MQNIVWCVKASDVNSSSAICHCRSAINHPFLDGNKRTGFMLAATFLELNGLTFAASEESVVANTLALAAGKMNEIRYAAWLKENSRRA